MYDGHAVAPVAYRKMFNGEWLEEQHADCPYNLLLTG